MSMKDDDVSANMESFSAFPQDLHYLGTLSASDCKKLFKPTHLY